MESISRLRDNTAMLAWIKMEGNINAKYTPTIVHASEDATRLSENDAQKLCDSANDAYPEYSWSVVPVMGFSECIVGGHQKHTMHREAAKLRSKSL